MEAGGGDIFTILLETDMVALHVKERFIEVADDIIQVVVG